jgi:hypothetical protein
MNVTEKRYFTAEDAEDRRGKHNQLINSSALLYAGTAVHFWLHPIAKRYKLTELMQRSGKYTKEKL